ncbi:uncharacterized protein N7511_010820 [Penicillium nucicola]|uniref:uncharacterized protein n=1 Tax=Penicillium nucicola TaxID=1850975 RepID=UPI002545A66E|nr:uncharacterized protein N7511_010820 [Penicillium nucicola]KAJ5749124.1 hypothetical protein N7511_010820 [Penicillium nucicola]
MASSDPNASNQDGNMRWQFIDSSNNSRTNLTQVKRHVMQEYMRQKKGGRQSDSEEETPQPKRGRPKNSRASKRNTAKGSKDNKGAKGKKPEKTELSTEDEDIEEICQDKTTQRLPSNKLFVQDEKGLQILPFRPSPHQSHAVVIAPHDYFDISPQSAQSQDRDFNSPSWPSAPTTPYELMHSPKTIMSAARTDPFKTLPVDLDLDGQRLFDFYVNTMPACSYGSHFRSAKAHNWYTAVFVPEGMKGAVAFQNTIIVHAANTWAWVRSESETPDTLLHRDRAVTMLREHLSNNPHDISDVAIISCLSAAALEDFDPRPGHKEISWVHMRAAREMIRARGGPAAFAYTRLGKLINWQDYILSGYETHGPSFFYQYEQPAAIASEYSHQSTQNIHSMPSPPYSTSSALDLSPSPEPKTQPTFPPPTNTTPVDEIKLQCEEFLDFLRRCEQLSLYQRDNPESSHLTRQTTVQDTSILNDVLSAPPGARFTSVGGRKQMVARITALIILNAALWDYRYTPARASLFLSTLETAMIDSEVGMSGSVEAILQILLECNDGSIEFSPASLEHLPDYSQYGPTASSPAYRPWYAGRMLKIAKRLCAESWYRVSDFLFSCLTLQVQEPCMALWEADLRQEILDAPLTSYLMRSLID